MVVHSEGSCAPIIPLSFLAFRPVNKTWPYQAKKQVASLVPAAFLDTQYQVMNVGLTLNFSVLYFLK